MRHILRLDGTNHAAALAGAPDDRRVLLDDAALSATMATSIGSAATLRLNGRDTKLHIANTGDHCFIWLDGETYEVAVLEPLTVYAKQAAAHSGLTSHAPMPGSVVALPVQIGDQVREGDILVIIESMKLEVSLRATQPGCVQAIACAVGATFDKDAVLITLAPLEGT